VTSAVGNDGPNWGTQHSPADMPEVIGVGGVMERGRGGGIGGWVGGGGRTEGGGAGGRGNGRNGKEGGGGRKGREEREGNRGRDRGSTPQLAPYSSRGMPSR
jgi:hypothetical protein